jgi:hypothetical protein
MAIAWNRLIRFVATDGRILRGEPILPSPDFDLGSTTAETQLQAKIISGIDPYDTTGATKVTDEVATVKELLGPLSQADVPILRCVGLNYAKHSIQSKSYCSQIAFTALTRCSKQLRKQIDLLRHSHSYSSSQSPLSPTITQKLSSLRSVKTIKRTMKVNWYVIILLFRKMAIDQTVYRNRS